jgi:two-component system, LytTR family, sensor histidine kinase AlgZ
MHPILARGGRLALYLGLWLLIGVLLALLLATQGGAPARAALLIALPLSTIYAFMCLSAWYVARGLPLGAAAGMRVATTATAASLIASGAWVAMAHLWTQYVGSRSGLAAAGTTPPRLESLLFGFGVLLYLLSLAVSYLLVAAQASQDAQRRGLQAQVLAREAELRSLRAQIDPHFLFNSLHSISALTTADPAAARRMCVLLGEFLRETVALGAEASITLARELSLVDRFLTIERVRFGDRLQTEISAGNAAGCRVPPLLLQPVVENAVTHGVAHVLSGGTIRVAAARENGRLRIVVENPCDPDRPKTAGTGVGLGNVRARLRALHGADAHLTAMETEGRWQVELQLPAEDQA